MQKNVLTGWRRFLLFDRWGRLCHFCTVLSVFFLAASAAAQPLPGGMPPAPVSVAKVEKRDLNIGQTFVGTVEPVRMSTVGSTVEGRVINFLVNEGDRVSKGQSLAQLRVRSLEIERDAAKAQLAFHQGELDELEVSRPKEIEQAKARMDAAEALVTFNRWRLEQIKTLFENGKVASEEELKQQISDTTAAEESYTEAKAVWELATSGLWEAKINQAKSRIQAQQEAVNRLEDDIQEHTIVAPFDGFVTKEHTEVGQWIAKGGPVVEIVELDYVDVKVPVLEKYLPQLRTGAEARVEIEALPEILWTGEVALIVPSADVRSRNFPVKVRLKNKPIDDNAAGASVMLKPGMLARVTLPVGQFSSAMMVPKDALVLGEQSPIVWVVEPGRAPNTAGVRPVPVELGISYEEMIEVRGPLEAGQLVVVEGNERLNPMSRVTIKKGVASRK